MWRCEQCGIEKPLRYKPTPTSQLRKRLSRTCEGKCHGLHVSGKYNPAYRTGRRVRKPAGPPRPKMTPRMLEIITAWDKRNGKLTGKELADALGFSREAVYLYLRKSR